MKSIEMTGKTVEEAWNECEILCNAALKGE